jgi:hypothetical protein
LDAAAGVAESPDKEDVRAAVKHFLAVLTTRAPGKSGRGPRAAVRRGAVLSRAPATPAEPPPAVVETDAETWLRLARGQEAFVDAQHDGGCARPASAPTITAAAPAHLTAAIRSTRPLVELVETWTLISTARSPRAG